MAALEFSHEEVLEHIRDAILEELSEMKRAHKKRPIATVAWLARNLLELGVWAGYCVMSEKNANRFAKDAARDSVHMLDVPTEISKDAGVSFRAVRKSLIEKGKKEGIGDIDKGFLAVFEASKILGSKATFAGLNRVLSKFAHPTALRVMTTKASTERLREPFYNIGQNLLSPA